MKRILPSILVILLPVSSIAQVFSNLDFEYGVYKDQPRKWSIEGEGEYYFAKLDNQDPRHGKRSLFCTIRGAQVFIFLSIPGAVIAGKKVHVDVYFKSNSADSLQAMLIFHNPAGGKPIPSRPADSRNSAWQVVSHEASFPTAYSSDRLLIALVANGSGRFWMDDVRITVDDKDYGNGLADFREPSKKEIALLDAKAVPFPETASNNASAFSKMIGNATIVALGENSHGSASIYEVKLEMIKHMVEEMGFSVFALEAPTVEADKINEYVSSGKGTEAEVIQNLVYPSWQTPSMLNIIHWIREYNSRNTNKIQFRGFDMQNGLSAFQALEDFAKENDPDLVQQLDKLKQSCAETPKSEQQWDTINLIVNAIRRHVVPNRYPKIDSGDVENIRHYLDIFVQSLSSGYSLTTPVTRDDYMARNIDWLATHTGKNARIIVSADNTHVTRASGKMGALLSNLYGDRYFNVGFTFDKGSYSAYGVEKYYEVHPSYPGTYEYLFSKSRFANFILSINPAPDIELLNQVSGFRSIGSRPQETTQFSEINLKDHFDAIVFIRTSRHTESLSK